MRPRVSRRNLRATRLFFFYFFFLIATWKHWSGCTFIPDYSQTCLNNIHGQLAACGWLGYFPNIGKYLYCTWVRSFKNSYWFHFPQLWVMWGFSWVTVQYTVKIWCLDKWHKTLKKKKPRYIEPWHTSRNLGLEFQSFSQITVLFQPRGGKVGGIKSGAFFPWWNV